MSNNQMNNNQLHADQNNPTTERLFRGIEHIHFLGINGCGMSGIAEVLLRMGYRVTGSDLNENPIASRLRNLGAQITIGHSREQCPDADLIVVSTAISGDNPELQAAFEREIPTVSRAEMLAEIMRQRIGLAVTGTHGKTTTTGILASLFEHTNQDPTYVVGGVMLADSSPARYGRGKHMIIEADESDASFLYYHPAMTIITNIDCDHMQTYAGDYKQLEATFLRYIHQLPFYGLAVMCMDDENIRKILPKVRVEAVTYGFREDADVQIFDVVEKGLFTEFTIAYPNFTDLSRHQRAKIKNTHFFRRATINKDNKLWSNNTNSAPSQSGKELVRFTVPLPGRHNVLNATAALIVAHECGIAFAELQEALLKFSGVGRRLQQYGEQSINGKPANGQFLLIDDYGHHPCEIIATQQSLQAAWPERRKVVAFQPHRYTRTHDLFHEFVDSLIAIDLLFILDVYPAGEQPIAGSSGKDLFDALKAKGHNNVYFVENPNQLAQDVYPYLQNGDVLLLQGAGNITTCVDDFLSTLRE